MVPMPEVSCPVCGSPVPVDSDEVEVECPNCGALLFVIVEDDEVTVEVIEEPGLEEWEEEEEEW